jgi:stalled ribosome rescue protein Dom34
VLRTPIAYPVFLKRYEQQRVAFQRSTGIAGLYSIGRNGEFDHILMEDVYVRTQRRMTTVLQELRRRDQAGAVDGASLAAVDV